MQPSVAGPKRPQDRINLPELGKTFRELLEKPVQDGGYGKKHVDLREKHVVELNGSAPRNEDMVSTDIENQGIKPGDERNKLEMIANRPTPDPGKEIEAESSEIFKHGRAHIGHGSVLIAAITSCTNTSNPERDARRGFARKKSGRTRHARRSRGKNVACSRIARSFRLSGESRTANVSRSTRIQSGRLRLHHLHRQLRAAASKHRESD